MIRKQDIFRIAQCQCKDNLHQFWWEFSEEELMKFVENLVEEIKKDGPLAWTGRGCGVIHNNTREGMIQDRKHGGEFRIAAEAAKRHNIPLFPIDLDPNLSK